MNLEEPRPDRAHVGTITHRERRLRRALVSGKPHAAPALPFSLVWGFQDLPLATTIAAAYRVAAARKSQRCKTDKGLAGPRRPGPNPGRRVSLLAPISGGSVVRGGGHQFGTTAALRPGASAVNPPATVPYGAAGHLSAGMDGNEQGVRRTPPLANNDADSN